MLDFYKGLLGGQGHSRYPIYLEVIEQGPVLIVEQQIHMCKNFSAKDIKEAIFSIPNIKSPSPDGYSNGFFKSTWHKVGLVSAEQSNISFTQG